MNERQLEQALKAFQAPPANENAKKRAMNIALAEFDKIQIKKKAPKKTQSDESSSSNSLMTKITALLNIDKKMAYGGLATAMCLMLVTGVTVNQYRTESYKTSPVEMAQEEMAGARQIAASDALKDLYTAPGGDIQKTLAPKQQAEKQAAAEAAQQPPIEIAEPEEPPSIDGINLDDKPSDWNDDDYSSSDDSGVFNPFASQAATDDEPVPFSGTRSIAEIMKTMPKPPPPPQAAEPALPAPTTRPEASMGSAYTQSPEQRRLSARAKHAPTKQSFTKTTKVITEKQVVREHTTESTTSGSSGNTSGSNRIDTTGTSSALGTTGDTATFSGAQGLAETGTSGQSSFGNSTPTTTTTVETIRTVEERTETVERYIGGQQGYGGVDDMEDFEDNPIKSAARQPVSTFALDVGSASYQYVADSINGGALPKRSGVRIEEMLNHFDYSYPSPTEPARPISAYVSTSDSPWNEGNKLVRIAIKGYGAVGDDADTIAENLKLQVEFNPDNVAQYRLIGYETHEKPRRKLFGEKEDENTGEGDAGISAGHSATAIYEITPVASASGSYGLVKMRYNLPGSVSSLMIAEQIRDGNNLPEVMNSEFGFAMAVAAFGQILRGGAYTGGFSYDDVIALAEKYKSPDPSGQKAAFIDLVKRAKALRSPY